MKKFVKNSHLDKVIIPGKGSVAAGQILEGDEFARFAPRYLTEVPEVPQVAPLETRAPRSALRQLVEPAPVSTTPLAAIETPEAPKNPTLTEVEKEAPPVKSPRGSKPPKNA